MTMTSNERRAATAPSSPVGTSLRAAKRSLSRLGRKHSNGSVQSSSSGGTARSAEGVGVRQPAKNKIRRHQHRLSMFGRGETATAGEEPAVTDDPSELSSHVTAPGILKIFGNEICQGANYKSVLATTHSSAKELVKEALERYSLNKEDADAYVLCDVIGCLTEREWRSECVRLVGDNERPLLLQSLWKPREGYARRFEIHRRASVEEKISRDKDTVTAGINAQARRLQKTRSRGRSVVFDTGAAPAATPGLCRSLSEADLRTAPEPHRSLKSQQGVDAPETTTHKEPPCAAGETEEARSGDDRRTQYSIHPPRHLPYFLLLQGFSYRQDFVIYPLSTSTTVFGRDVQRSDVDSGATLWAPDIRARHCSVQRLASPHQNPPVGKEAQVTVLTPHQGAPVRRNGIIVDRDVTLHPGDVVALGDHYIFMFKDPGGESEAARSSPSTSFLLSQTPGTPEESLPCLRDAGGRELHLLHDVEHEALILKEIFRWVDDGEGAQGVTPAFLLCLCLQRSATCFPMTDLRRLLLHVANDVQTVVLEKAKDLAALQPETEDGGSETLLPNAPEKFLSGLQPLVMWMSNSVELLHFIHQEVPRLLYELSRLEEEEEEDCLAVLELRLSTVRPASEEAMTVLEDIITFTFQQCVYYLTKLLYQILPCLLESNPFSEDGLVQVPEGAATLLDLLTETLSLVRTCHMHPEMASHLFTYLFFFINTFLFNLLMEKGSGGRFYRWSCGVQIRAHLDVLMDWAYTAGLGELAQRRFLKLSSVVNLLATTRERLLQASWSSLRAEFSSLNPAQLHHLLTEYDPRWSCPPAWTPTGDDADAACQTTDIVESFDDHPPLVLPANGFLLELKLPVGDTGLINQLHHLQTFIEKLTDPGSDVHTPRRVRGESAAPLEAKRTRMEVPPRAYLEQRHTEVVLRNNDEPSSFTVPTDRTVGELLLNQKLTALALQTNGSVQDSTPDTSCLLTPPNTPLCSDLMKTETEYQDLDPRSCDETKREEGDGENNDAGDDEVFVVELQKGPAGLGLALVDGVETPFRTRGIYIKYVTPGSPAALCQKLKPGDRLLAVNGLELVGLDYHTGRELIQKAGDPAQLLVARTERINEDMVLKH
ncbi:ras-associating and dilute domain-containing protein [Trichomycterus rosablanca]|uniref:ras-associating and dilute domain-containing protein n=1 Tax=Trichomycterus rosablanca TaxID=2290929 RepID=UPI002F356E09